MSGLLGDWGRRKTREGEAKVVGGGCEAAGPEVSDNWACRERARPSFSSWKGEGRIDKGSLAERQRFIEFRFG